MLIAKRVDLTLLARELEAAAVPFNGLWTTGTADPESLEQELFTTDGAGGGLDLPPEAVPVVDRHDATRPGRTAAFEAAEDAERLRVINERARTDPAYAALAALVLKGGQP